MQPLWQKVNDWECPCGCGGKGGHILSTERNPGRCTALSTDEGHVIHRCSKPAQHSALVPHGDGEVVWSGRLD